MATATLNNTDRLRELGTAPIWRILLKYSLPAVVGTVVSAIYNIIDSIVIGHAIDDPNVVSGIAVTFPVMNLVTALGMLIGAGAATRVSIVLGGTTGAWLRPSSATACSSHLSSDFYTSVHSPSS